MSRRAPFPGRGRAVLLRALALTIAGAAAAAVFLARRDRAAEPTPPREPVPALDRVIDVGPHLGLPRDTRSWGVQSGDLTGDGRPDLIVSYHGRLFAYRNVEGTGLQELFRPRLGDAHDCAIADIDLDGLGDIYCTRGGGIRKEPGFTKTNGLWLQGPPGAFSANVAREYGVADPRGRGRRVTFLDINADGYPDLFVGNQTERVDGEPSPNRTFLNDRGRGFTELVSGATLEIGAHCLQAVDVDGDGWEDVLVCGEDRLYLFRNVERPDGTRGFRDIAGRIGIDLPRVGSAWIEDFDGDGRPDIAVLREDRLQVLLRPGGAFDRPVVDRPLRAGTWLVVGDVDGDGRPDLYAVQGCVDDRNVDNLLLMNTGDGFRPAESPQARAGCGDVATTVDLDGDGRDEVIVMNGRGGAASGPVQVLTRSPSLAP